jgi:hypothetical protein
MSNWFDSSWSTWNIAIAASHTSLNHKHQIEKNLQASSDCIAITGSSGTFLAPTNAGIHDVQIVARSENG